MIPSLYYSQTVTVVDGYASDYYGEYVSGASPIDASGSITSQVGSTAVYAISCNRQVEDETLEFRVETLQKVDVATVADAAITKNASTATLSLTSAMTTAERTLRWTLLAMSTGEAVASGLMFVTYDAQGDS